MVVGIMSNHLERKQKEYRLAALLRATEEKTLSNPKLKAMADQLRNSYQMDQAGFMKMLGMGVAPPKKQERVKLPQSKIPKLLMILDSLATKKPLSLPPTKRDLNIDNTPALLATYDRKTGNEIINMSPPKKNNLRRIVPANSINNSMLKDVDEEILNAKALYNSVKRDEGIVKSRKGKYALAVERLKAERVLREYPEMISHLEHKRKMIEEGVLS
jgi:hypothetical protein